MGSKGPHPPALPELTRAEDRVSFLYLERCAIHRDSNAITSTDENGTVHIPAASLGVLLLGPGTRISHHAVMLIAESGSTIVWVGEHGVRYYAHGRSLAGSAGLLLTQAALVSNRMSRLRVAREMYSMRFPDEDVSRLTMQQLRGREGARVRALYRAESQRTGVPWTRRDYAVDDFDSGTPVNQALSAANTTLYGVVHSVIVALGCSPGLGFVHTGHVRSFVYDIADLYKAQLTIPLAFDLAATTSMDMGGTTRRALRDRLYDSSILSRVITDIRALLRPDDNVEPIVDGEVRLWNDGSTVPAGRGYLDDTSDPTAPFVDSATSLDENGDGES
jgi:CRISPR-associated protein Cas1